MEGVSFERKKLVIRSNEGLTFETSDSKLLTVANLRYQPSWKLPNYLIRYRVYSDQILHPRSHIYHFPVPNFKFKTWWEKLNAGELRAQASKTNLNLRYSYESLCSSLSSTTQVETGRRCRAEHKRAARIKLIMMMWTITSLNNIHY